MVCMTVREYIFVFALFLLLVFLASASSAFEEYDNSKNYCGPNSGPSVLRSPSIADFSPACYEHDKCYSECQSTKHTQAYCDLEFLEKMVESCGNYYDEHYRPDCEDTTNFLWLQDICWNTANDQYGDCRIWASTYYSAVATLGEGVGSYKCDDSGWSEYNTEAKVTKRYNQIMDAEIKARKRDDGESLPCMSMNLPAILAFASAMLARVLRII